MQKDYEWERKNQAWAHGRQKRCRAHQLNDFTSLLMGIEDKFNGDSVLLDSGSQETAMVDSCKEERQHATQ